MFPFDTVEIEKEKKVSHPSLTMQFLFPAEAKTEMEALKTGTKMHFCNNN